MRYQTKEITCTGCGNKIELKVHKTCAYYAGFVCDECGPYDRVSGYMNTLEEVQEFISSRETFKSYWEE